MAIFKGKTYKLSEDKLIKIARLCVQEQGCTDGVKAEASQGANLLEVTSTYRARFGDDIYSMFRNSGWYYKAAYFMDNGHASDSAIEAVRDVLIKGNRVFPQYVNEHDCLGDISWVKNGDSYINKNDKSKYVRGKTVIKNVMGSQYTFYAFPAAGCDPFGYTAEAYKYVMENGGTPDTSIDEDTGRIDFTASLPELYKGCPKGKAVQLWRLIIGLKVTYKTFSPTVLETTKEWQKAHGLTPDGIVGKKTWAAGLKTLT